MTKKSKNSSAKKEYELAKEKYEKELENKTNELRSEIRSVLSEDFKALKEVIKFKQKFTINISVDVGCDFSYYFFDDMFEGIIYTDFNCPKQYKIESFLLDQYIPYDHSLDDVSKISPEVKKQISEIKKLKKKINTKVNKIMKKYSLTIDKVYELLQNEYFSYLK